MNMDKKTTQAKPAQAEMSEFDALIAGAKPIGGMFLAPTKAHDIPLVFGRMETATSKFAVDAEANPTGEIQVLRCTRTDTGDEVLLRLTSNRLLLAFQAATKAGLAFSPGTAFRVLVSGQGMKTQYAIIGEHDAESEFDEEDEELVANTNHEFIEDCYDDLALVLAAPPSEHKSYKSAFVAAQAAIEARMAAQKCSAREALLAIKADLSHKEEE